MRRPHRSIEVFDISLMAVVTKAMGAFLVLMLLLMPYYSSGPVGEKTAAELAEELKEAQKKLNSAIDNLKRGEITPEELERVRRLLEETQQRLQQAQTLADRLKRQNDQLNSQVTRLESELNESKQKLAEAKKENDLLQNQLAKLINPVLNVHLSNSDCLDVVMDVALWDRTRDKIEFVGRPPVKYSLNYFQPGHSFANRSILSDQIVTGFRSIISSKPEVVILVVRDKKIMKIDGEDGYLLKKSSKACNVLITAETFFPNGAGYMPWSTVNKTIAAATYAQVLWEAKVDNGRVLLTDPAAQDKAWLQEQVAKAKKAPEPKPPPPPPKKEEKPISKQEALAEIEKLPVPRSVDECMRLVGRAGEILSKARVPVPRAAAGREIQSACISNHFDEARKTLRAAAREAITGKKPEDNKSQPAKPLSKQEALAEIEKLPVPRSVGECFRLLNQTGGILSKAQVHAPPAAASLGRIRDACTSSHYDEARNIIQTLAREALTGKTADDNRRQPSGTLSKQEALTEVEKISVPHSFGECMDLVRRVGSTLTRSQTKLPDGNWAGNIQRACSAGHFDEAQKRAQMSAREAITANKKSEDTRQEPSKDAKETAPFSKQQAIAMVDRLPVPRDPPSCMQMLMRAMRLQTVMHVIDAQSRGAVPAIRDDCAAGHFEDALNKTKAEMHRVLK